MIEYLKQLHHIGLPTSNMNDTVDFYSKLGAMIVFDKMDEDETGNPCRVVHMQLSNLKIEIYERDEIAGMPGAFDHIAFEVSDIEKAFQWAQAMGFAFLEEKINSSSYWPGGARWFILLGCNGERVEFCQ